MTTPATDRGRGGGHPVAAALAVAVLAGLIGGCSGDSRTAAPPSTPISPAPAAPVTDPYAPAIDRAAFSSTVNNPYFPLRPGMRWQYRAKTQDGIETTLVEVTARTRVVMGVTCVEVRDTVRLNGEIIEDTLDWYAGHRDGAVWYFGEDTKEYEGSKVVGTKGSWEAGVRGAQPGILMPAHPRPGDRYRQEYLRGEAEDLAEVLSVAEHAQVPAGSYDGVAKTEETTALEPKALEHKYYARGIGPILTIDVAGGGTRDELLSVTS
jgi:hypothetical protein